VAPAALSTPQASSKVPRPSATQTSPEWGSREHPPARAPRRWSTRRRPRRRTRRTQSGWLSRAASRKAQKAARQTTYPPLTTFTTFATRITYERFPSGLESTARLPFQTGNRPGGGPSHLCVMRRGVSLVLGALLAGVVLLPATAQAKGSRLRFAEEAYARGDRAARRPAREGSSNVTLKDCLRHPAERGGLKCLFGGRPISNESAPRLPDRGDRPGAHAVSRQHHQPFGWGRPPVT
jgi:hypothetical protein